MTANWSPIAECKLIYGLRRQHKSVLIPLIYGIQVRDSKLTSVHLEDKRSPDSPPPDSFKCLLHHLDWPTFPYCGVIDFKPGWRLYLSLIYFKEHMGKTKRNLNLTDSHIRVTSEDLFCSVIYELAIRLWITKYYLVATPKVAYAYSMSVLLTDYGALLKPCPHIRWADGWTPADISGSGCIGYPLAHVPPCHMSVNTILYHHW